MAGMLMVIALPSLSPAVTAQSPGLYDQAWRKAARQRIEQHRKADVHIRAGDLRGPLPETEVHIEMLRHAFPFGCAVSAKRIVADHSPDGTMYRTMVTSLFNRVVLENDLKWKAWSGEWTPGHSREQTQAAVDWLERNGIEVRGHCLVWPGWEHLPRELKNLEQDPESLRQRVLDHIGDLAGTFQGRLVDWDVVNETFWNRDLQNLLGPDILVEWFKAARAADPQARLYINDARIVAFGSQEQEHKDYYFNEVQRLVQAGAPLDGIGFQSHFYDHALSTPEQVQDTLDRFADFGLSLAITEYDYLTEDEDRQARYMYDFMHMVFSHPSVTQFIMWSFWEGQVWKKPCALFREDWTPKPSGQVFKDLVLDTWWTRANGRTDDQGNYRTRGFLGDYLIRVKVGANEHAFTTRLDRVGLNMEIVVSDTGEITHRENK